MERYKLTLDYDGTNYAGWQVQPGHVTTIQGTLLANLTKVCRSENPVVLVGCGRTDAGVHARAYVAHADLVINDGLSLRQLMFKLNRMLPGDIAITAIEPVADGFHARYDAVSRSYQYHLHASKDVFNTRFSTEYPYKVTDLDIDSLNTAAAALIGEHDYTAFCKTGGDVKHHRCIVTRAYWEQVNTYRYVFQISANRFLRGMIRLVVGMCCNVSRGKLTTDQVTSALTKAQRLPLDWSMPPQGLVLTDIKY